MYARVITLVAPLVSRRPRIFTTPALPLVKVWSAFP
jgi:hypothetical protein